MNNVKNFIVNDPFRKVKIPEILILLSNLEFNSFYELPCDIIVIYRRKEFLLVHTAIRGFDLMNYNPLYGWEDGTTERIIKWVKEKGGIATSSWHINVPSDFTSYKHGRYRYFGECI